ncbi:MULTISPECIES: hypothetical protein [Nocardia]|uniref:hypothetical protein n=1 Tax=Nocardia TaxID=1817 RepID=UPI0013009120|nr:MULTISPECIES: hypothetical protein [Nocardia]
MNGIILHLPERSTDRISEDLRTLTEAICDLTGEDGGGGLGGRYGYGIEHETDVFAMFPFWWDDCTCGWETVESDWVDAHPHADDCYQTEFQRRTTGTGTGLDYADFAREWGLPEQGSAYHCTCPRGAAHQAWRSDNPHPATCPVVRPNFRYKPTGATVEWYKYIGRDMEVKGELPVDFLAHCLASLTESQ